MPLRVLGIITAIIPVMLHARRTTWLVQHGTQRGACRSEDTLYTVLPVTLIRIFCMATHMLLCFLFCARSSRERSAATKAAAEHASDLARASATSSALTEVLESTLLAVKNSSHLLSPGSFDCAPPRGSLLKSYVEFRAAEQAMRLGDGNKYPKAYITHSKVPSLPPAPLYIPSPFMPVPCHIPPLVDAKPLSRFVSDAMLACRNRTSGSR